MEKCGLTALGSNWQGYPARYTIASQCPDSAVRARHESKISVGDFNRPRGSVSEQGQKGPQALIHGFIPMAERFDYIIFGRSATSDRCTFTIEFTHYAEVSAGLVDTLMEREEVTTVYERFQPRDRKKSGPVYRPLFF